MYFDGLGKALFGLLVLVAVTAFVVGIGSGWFGGNFFQKDTSAIFLEEAFPHCPSDAVAKAQSERSVTCTISLLITITDGVPTHYSFGDTTP
jgi:hypothetical protein